MAKSLRSLLNETMALVVSLGLTQKSAYAIRIDSSGISIQMEAFALVQVSRQLNVPRSKIRVSNHTYQGEVSVHIDFKARGANWCTVIQGNKLAEFNAALAASQQAKLTVEPRRLDAPTKRLVAQSAPELF